MNLETCLRSARALNMPIELLTLITSADARLSVIELADKLAISRRRVLLMLVTLECHGMLRWEDTARLYLPDSSMLSLLFHAMSSTAGHHHSQPETVAGDTVRTSLKRPNRTRTLNSRKSFDTSNAKSQRSMA